MEKELFRLKYREDVESVLSTRWNRERSVAIEIIRQAERAAKLVQAYLDQAWPGPGQKNPIRFSPPERAGSDIIIECPPIEEEIHDQLSSAYEKLDESFHQGCPGVLPSQRRRVAAAALLVGGIDESLFSLEFQAQAWKFLAENSEVGVHPNFVIFMAKTLFPEISDTRIWDEVSWRLTR